MPLSTPRRCYRVDDASDSVPIIFGPQIIPRTSFTWFTPRLVSRLFRTFSEVTYYTELFDTARAGLREGPAGQLPGAPRRHWNNLKYGAGKLGFPYAKERLRKLSKTLARIRKNVRQPCPRPKKFKEYRVEGAPNY